MIFKFGLNQSLMIQEKLQFKNLYDSTKLKNHYIHIQDPDFERAQEEIECLLKLKYQNQPGAEKLDYKKEIKLLFENYDRLLKK